MLYKAKCDYNMETYNQLLRSFIIKFLDLALNTKSIKIILFSIVIQYLCKIQLQTITKTSKVKKPIHYLLEHRRMSIGTIIRQTENRHVLHTSVLTKLIAINTLSTFLTYDRLNMRSHMVVKQLLFQELFITDSAHDLTVAME